PQKNERSDDQLRGEIAQPPGDPNRAVVIPFSETGQREAGEADRWTNERAEDGGERKLEDALRPIENPRAIGEAINEPGPAQCFKRVSSGDTERSGNGPRRGEVYQERADKNRRPDAIAEEE